VVRRASDECVVRTWHKQGAFRSTHPLLLFFVSIHSKEMSPAPPFSSGHRLGRGMLLLARLASGPDELPLRKMGSFCRIVPLKLYS
jgi:hypothetical protein